MKGSRPQSSPGAPERTFRLTQDEQGVIEDSATRALDAERRAEQTVATFL
jgi:hypothetical protein